MKKHLLELSKTVGAVMVIITACGFFGEPFLEDYVQIRIQKHQDKLDKDRKESFRTLLGKSLKVDSDEVTFILRDAVNDVIKVKKEIKYYHPTTLLDK